MEQERRVRDCKVCGQPHDDELHEVILRLREWHRLEVTKNFVPESEEELVA